jgi:hypothetical protein
MVYTNLTNHENNLPVIYDSSWKVSQDRIQASLEHRIEAHRKYIVKHQKVITNNIEYRDLVEDALECIKQREAKIIELQELMEYTFNIR